MYLRQLTGIASTGKGLGVNTLPCLLATVMDENLKVWRCFFYDGLDGHYDGSYIPLRQLKQDFQRRGPKVNISLCAKGGLAMPGVGWLSTSDSRA